MLISFVGRVHEVSGNISDVAAEAARSASLRQDPTIATEVIRNSVRAQLDEICESLSISVDTENFRPSGSVTVGIDCRVSLLELSLLSIPSTMLFQAEATEVIDRYRAGVVF